MRHLEIRDLWLQKEIADGKIEVSKIPGDRNPADLMTKILSRADIEQRLGEMHLWARFTLGNKQIVCLEKDCISRRNSLWSCIPSVQRRLTMRRDPS